MGLLGFDGVAALDLVGPLEAFATAGGYTCRVYGLSRRPFRAESGLLLCPDATLKEASRIDTLIIPGGSGLRIPATNARMVEWLRAAAPRIRRVAAVCTGIYGLAPTGLLDGRRVTTHWSVADLEET